jgi:hypothetical protein
MADLIKMDSVSVREYFRTGNVSQLNDTEKDFVLSKLCERYDLDPILRPFDLISFRGVAKFYMTASATNQLADKKKLSRKVVSIELDAEKMIARCSVQVSDPSGRCEDSNAFISIGKYLPPSKDNPVMKKVLLDGEDLANALLKLETKAKRRATLSFFGILDAGADFEDKPTVQPDPFIDVKDSEDEPKKLVEAKKPRKTAEKTEEIKKPEKTEQIPLVQTKTKEDEIDAHIEKLANLENEFSAPQTVAQEEKKVVYSRTNHAEFLIKAVNKIMNDSAWTKNEEIKNKVKAAIPALDGTVPCFFEGSKELCTEFINALKGRIC